MPPEGDTAVETIPPEGDTAGKIMPPEGDTAGEKNPPEGYTAGGWASDRPVGGKAGGGVGADSSAKVDAIASCGTAGGGAVLEGFVARRVGGRCDKSVGSERPVI